MKQLWAPWRMNYIDKSSAHERSDEKNECIFCQLPKQKNDQDNLILYRGKKVFIVMNLYPYNNGHIMVAPYHHVHTLSILDPESYNELTLLIQKSVKIIETVFQPQGLNVGMNIGKAAGAGFAEHIHMHIVPRWNGDTNFMPVFSETRVISEHLLSTYEKLHSFFKEII